MSRFFETNNVRKSTFILEKKESSFVRVKYSVEYKVFREQLITFGSELINRMNPNFNPNLLSDYPHAVSIRDVQ